MDVGPHSSFPSSWRILRTVIGASLAYQYWLWAAHMIARATAGTPAEGPGQAAADWMARSFAGFAKRSLGERADLGGGHITADARYPYQVFQSGWGVRQAGLACYPAPVPIVGGPEPPCPCLYLYGARKPFMFHTPAWIHHLEEPPDCAVVRVDAGHWLHVERPEKVNCAVESWPESTLPKTASRL